MGRILVGWDGSPASDGALEFAAGLASRDDELVVLTVIPAHLKDRSFLGMLFPGMELPKGFEPATYETNAKLRLEERLSKLEPAGKVRALVRSGDPADEILTAVHKERASHLVVGYKSYETNLPFQLGSVVEKLVRHSTAPITVWRPVSARSASPR